MKKLLFSAAAVLLVSICFIACQKEKQDVPAPQEEVTTLNQGNGIMETVQRGPNGNNVIFSNWITKTEADWTGFGSTEIKTDFNTTSLTDAVKNQGLVLVYFEYPNGSIYLLPYVRLEFQQVIDFSFITGKITASVRMINMGAITGVADLKFRYILIPASAFGGGNGRMSPPVDYKNYNAVCDYYGIKN